VIKRLGFKNGMNKF